MAAAHRYGVASFHININIGDGAIHILFSFTDAAPATKTVERAVFLDGGHGIPNFYDSDKRGISNMNIYRTIRQIEEDFECQGPLRGGSNGTRKMLQFDAFVVSHWDKDHSQGLMWFLVDDIEDAHSRRQPGEAIKLSRAVYDHNNALASTLFAPTWNKKHKPAWRAKTFSWEWDKYFKAGDHDNTATKLKLDATVSIRYAPGVGQWADGVLRIRIGTENLLGCNFFARELVDALDATHGSITALLTANKPEVPHAVPAGDPVPLVPGMYCVAANARVLGGTEDFDKRITTEKNASSIITLVIWNQNSYVSHYSAGDAHILLEEAVMDWMGYQANDNNGVRVVKMSHHGSATSNPHTLWTRLKPFNVVCSAGDKKTFGHPRWEVLHDLESWLTYNLSSVAASPHPLFLTMYPYYLGIAPEAGEYQKLSFKESEDVFERMVNDRQAFITARANAVPPNLAAVPYNIGDGYFHEKTNGTLTAEKLLRGIYKNIRWQILLSVKELHQLRYDRMEYIRFENFGSDGAARNNTEVRGSYSGVRVIQEGNIIRHRQALQLLSGHDTRRLSCESYCSDFMSVGSEPALQFQDSVYLVVPEDSIPLGIDDGTTVEKGILPKTNLLHPFVQDLATGLLRLQHCPKPGERTPFADTDEWQTWFRHALNTPLAQLNFTAAKWPLDDSDTGQFDISITLADNRVLVLDTQGAPTALGVSSAAIANMVSARSILP
ncbi:hypothetical protein B0T22DRAFT_379908, partial [Podospora appendiculata]